VRDLIEGEAKPLAAQDELEPYSVPVVEDPSAAPAFRGKKPAVLVVSNSSASSPIVQVRSLITRSFD
jgi:hypothetical protein